MYDKLTKGDLAIIIKCIIGTVIFFLITVFIIPALISNEQTRLYFSTITSTVGAALIVSVLWDIFAKKRFAESIFEIANISLNIRQSGVDTIDTKFSNINWESELSKTHHLTAVFTYARTWRHSNSELLKIFAKKNCLTIIMPNYENEIIMNEFDRRYGYDSGKTSKLIQEAISEYKEIGAEVRLYDNSLYATYYVMDNAAIMSFYRHSLGSKSVPYIRSESSGRFYEYIAAEVDAIVNDSVEAKSPNIKAGNK